VGKAGQVGLVALGLTLATVGFAISARGAARQPHPPFTVAWMEPRSGGFVEIGITSHEDTTLSYSVQLRQGPTMLREWASISLRPGQSWQVTAMAPPGDVAVLIYREDKPAAPYRHLNLASGLREGMG
jgi:hypothetical protein